MPPSYNVLMLYMRIQHFRLSVAMETNRNEEFLPHFYAWSRTSEQTFLKKVIIISAMRQQLKQVFIFPIISL